MLAAAVYLVLVILLFGSWCRKGIFQLFAINNYLSIKLLILDIVESVRGAYSSTRIKHIWI